VGAEGRVESALLGEPVKPKAATVATDAAAEEDGAGRDYLPIGCPTRSPYAYPCGGSSWRCGGIAPTLGGKIAAMGHQWATLGYPGASIGEPEVHDVAVFNRVVLAL
jgi:hypothetical protein